MQALKEIYALLANEVFVKDIPVKENSIKRLELLQKSQLFRCNFIINNEKYQEALPVIITIMHNYGVELLKFDWFYEKMHLDILINKDINIYITGLIKFINYYNRLSQEKYMEIELKKFICFYYAFIHREEIDKIKYEEVDIFYNNYNNINYNIRQFAPDREYYRKWLEE